MKLCDRITFQGCRLHFTVKIDVENMPAHSYL